MDATAITVLIPAYMEAARITATVTAARQLPGITRVVVIDDGSTDDTARLAETAGADVLRTAQNGGKGAALRTGLAACPGAPDDIILLLDADLGATAAEAAALLQPVVAGEADMTIAGFPKLRRKAGFGLVKGLARWGTWLLTRNRLEAPISGQRACRRWVLDAAPIADGYGVEVAMNVAAGDAGARIMEVPVDMTHNATGRTLSGFKHRGRQYVHIFGALTAAAFGRTGGSLVEHLNPLRTLCWLLALAVALAPVFKAGHFHLPVSASAVPGIGIGLLLAAIFSGLFRARRRNFAGRYIPALGGLVLLPALLFPLVAVDARVAGWQSLSTVFPPVALLGWLLLGLIDDVAGNAQRKGFRGHLLALLRGQLTTGGVKLLGGGVLALAMAWYLPRAAYPSWVTIPVGALLIALSANTMNLFDLRPGRALKVFWACAFPLLFLTPVLLPARHLPSSFLGSAGAVILGLLVLLVLATLVFAPLDFAGMMMLGDTGANPLGAFLGFYLMLVLPFFGQVVAVLLLIGLQLYAERASITKTIERTPWLRWLDQLGRSI